MNHIVFSQILTDLPDEILDAAAKPSCGKPVLRYSLPAIAAGIVLLIAAAVWPKLRTELPGVTEPPVQTAVTTAAVTSEAAQAVTVSTYTAVTNAQTTGTLSAVTQTAAATVTAYTTAVTEQSTATAVQAETAVPAAVTETAPHTTKVTQPTESGAVVYPSGTGSISGNIDESGRPETESTAVQTASPRDTVPFWQSVRTVPASASLETVFDVSFRLCPQDANDRFRHDYGIPDDYDLTKHRCLLVEIDTGYTAAAVLGGQMTPDGFVLKVAFLDQIPNHAAVTGAIPLPDQLKLDPEQCRLESVIVTDEAEFQAMITEQPTIDINM